MREIIRAIKHKTPEHVALIQLAEEANELAIVCLNLRYAIRHGEETNELKNDFIEEVADVKLCSHIIINNIKSEEVVNLDNLTYETYEILAKNCCNLSKAAIKYRRALLPKESPTPINKKEAKNNFIKSLILVKECIEIIGNYWDCDDVNSIYDYKAKRWIERLT